MVRIGFDKQCITPSHSIALSGYAGLRISTGVHDDLYARCIAMESNQQRYLLVQCDCLAVDDTLHRLVLSKISDLNIHENALIISATHTHSGPAGTIDTTKQPFKGLEDVFGFPNPEYMDYLAAKIAAASRNALSELLECQLTIGKGIIEHVGSERHDPSLPGDDSLLVLHFKRTDGKTALIYNYACHPTVLGPSNRLITADFPYAVEQTLPCDMTMFINGNAGDLSTRFTRKTGSFEQIEEYAKILVSGIQNALAAAVYEGSFDTVQMQTYPISLPVKQLGNPDVLKSELEDYENKLKEARAQGLDSGKLRILASYAEGAKVALSLAESLNGLQSIETQFSLIRLQNLTFATIPGELFSTLGARLKAQDVHVFGYTNGYYMYLADEASYKNNYYEAMSSPFIRGTGEYLIKEILTAKDSFS